MTKQEIKEYFATKSQFCEQRDFHLTADTWGIIFEIVENAQQEILDRAIKCIINIYIPDHDYDYELAQLRYREKVMQLLSTLKDTNI